MSDDRYAGWQPLIEELRSACAPYAIVPHVKPKNGQLAVELPSQTSIELQRFAEEIEQHSNRTCQRCGAEGGVEVVEQRGWILKTCPACHTALLGAMSHNRG